MKPLISVIIPVYNVEKYLEESVRSVLEQTYENLEIFLIDDGSTDSSGEICDSLAQSDKRVTVVHKENSGVAEARNLGLTLIHGEFFCFCDSDDRMLPELIENLYTLIQAERADIAEGAYVFSYEDGSVKRTKNFHLGEDETVVHSGEEAFSLMMYSLVYSPGVNSKLYRRESVRLSFPKYRIGEDLLATAGAYLNAEKIAYSNRPLYLYLQREQSAMHSEQPDKIFETVASALALMPLVEEKSSDACRAAEFFVTEKSLKALMRLYGVKGQEDSVKSVFASIKKYRGSVLRNKNAPAIIKLNCAVSYLGVRALYLFKALRAKIGG